MAIKDKKLNAFNVMIKKQNIELGDTKIDIKRAKKLEFELEESFLKLNNKVSQIENDTRDLSSDNKTLDLAELTLMRKYLAQQRALIKQEKIEKDNVNKLVEQLNAKMVDQNTSLRLYEKLHGKQSHHIKTENEKKHYIELDELYAKSRQIKI